jgi:DNA-binding NarL/FixJ family response regulator
LEPHVGDAQEGALKTVRNHVSAILVKLQVPDRASTVAKARNAGLDTNPKTAGGPFL